MAWLAGYSKRKAITITGGASGAQTDFQLSLAVSYEAAMQGDFDDLRFTQADGETLIDAWLKAKVDGSSADVWAEFPTTPANTVEQTYYMYYGNAGAASDWDGAATFLFYDDGEGHSDGDSITTGGWTIAGGTYEYDNSKAYAGSMSLYGNSYGNWAWQNFTNPAADGSAVLEFDIYDNGGSYGAAFITNQTGTDAIVFGYYSNHSATYYITEYGTGYISLADTVTRSVGWHHFKMEVAADGSAKFTIDGDESTTTAPAGELDDAGRVHIRDYSNSLCWWDRIRVRKYAANPPTYAFGAEESAPSGGNPFWYYNMLKRRNS